GGAGHVPEYFVR
nr:Chain A, Microcin J25 [Escherichia coli]5T56_C Chain C, Microcin J25 [Escherichia coli]